MRAPVDTIAAPLFPTALPWVNTNGAQASILQRGKPMLVEFWDFCRPNSLRTLPYVKAWHERYAEEGLRVIGVHCPGFEPSRDEQAVRDAVVRLGILHPVLIDSELELWREYDNRGWPARYLFDGRARLFEYHYGEGAYQETELAIQELLGVTREPLEPLRAEDAPGARLVAQTEDQPGAWSGDYEAGGVWAVLEGSGTVTFSVGESGSAGAERSIDSDAVRANGEKTTRDGHEGQTHTLSVEHPGAYPLIEHARHTAGTLDLEVGEGVVCHATCFTPGVL
jgi:thiol-disulfide isomerase/thioredoxin